MPSKHPFATINVRAQFQENFKTAKGQTYEITAPSELHKSKVKVILDYRLHGESFYRAENLNDSPVTVNIYNI